MSFRALSTASARVPRSSPCTTARPRPDILGEYFRLQSLSLNKAGFKPTWYAEAWGALNSSGWTDTADALFDGWDTGTPGSVATQLENGAHVSALDLTQTRP